MYRRPAGRELDESGVVEVLVVQPDWDEFERHVESLRAAAAGG